MHLKKPLENDMDTCYWIVLHIPTERTCSVVAYFLKKIPSYIYHAYKWQVSCNETSFSVMANRRMSRQTPFLTFLYTCAPRQRKSLVEHATNEQILALSQIALNILRGNVQITKAYKRKLKQYKEVIRSLASRRVSISRKRETLLKHHGLIPLLIKPTLQLLDGES